MIDICCIGHVTLDKIVTPQKTVYMAGGTSFYMAYGIKQLPPKASFQLITKVGDEQRKEIERMRHAGIDVVCYDSAHTVYFENRYGMDTNHRTQRVLAKADPFTLDEVEPLEAEIFHLGSLLADDFSPEVVAALAAKGRVSIDVQGFLREVRGENVHPIGWKNQTEILRYTDILKLNEYEMVTIGGSNNPREVALGLAAMGVREVVITLGNYGSYIWADNKFYEIPAYEPTEQVDATGCGDTYSTGYLYMRSQGADCFEAGKFAAAMCTIKLAHSGPFDATIEDIERVAGQSFR